MEPVFQLKKLLAEEERYPNSTEDAMRIVRRLQLHFGFPKGTLFFDVGAGCGFFSHAAQQAGFTVKACEPNPSCRPVFAELNGFEPDPEMFNPSIAKRYVGAFEVFLLSQVLEHITNLDETLDLIRLSLKAGGITVVAVPLFRSFFSQLRGKRDMFIIPPEHVNFFTYKSLRTLFKRFAFSPVLRETVSRFDHQKIASNLKLRGITIPILSLTSLFMKLTDKIHRGLYLNAYFQKD